ncbi:MAG: PEP-utilizing enzyme [archaeon]
MKNFSDYNFFWETGRSCYFIFEELVNEAYSFKSDFPINTIVGSISKNNVTKWFYIRKKNDDFKKQMETYIKNPDLIHKAEQVLINGEREIRKAMNCDFTNISDEELTKKFRFFRKKFVEVINIPASIRVSGRYLLRRLKKVLNKKDIETASLPLKQSFVFYEEKAILELAVKLKERNITTEDVSKMHSEFSWAGAGYFIEKENTKAEYVKEVKKAMEKNPEKRLKQLEKMLEKNRKKQEELFSKHKEVVVKTSAWMIYLKDLYKENSNKIIIHGKPMFAEIARRTGKPKDYVYELHPEEIINLLKGKKPNDKLVKERKRISVTICEKGNITILTGNKAEEFEKRYLSDYHPEDKEFRGRIASKGYAKGKIKIVHSEREFKDFKEGDILTTTSTGPDYIPIMKKAGAIIAEEGSLTSHVSVVSREFGIPCIVGIDHATDIFKDGDLVEVDANHGIVKKL